ncbi:MAG: YchJ family protein [Rectinemataceae bacterium]
MDTCPCGSGHPYETCCRPIISGSAMAPTAETLMRSRYSAYAKGEIDFIVSSCVRDESGEIDLEATRRWSEKSTWLGLNIVSTDKGGNEDSTGTVEFIATYVLDGLRDSHHEISHFVKKDGGWLYESGEMIPETVIREGPKVGRNDPCPCGSGKKYKKCHGAPNAV